MLLWWIGEGREDHVMMAEVRNHVGQTFGIPVQISVGKERPTDSFDASRGQHASSKVLRWLLGVCPPHAGKILAVTDVDLFIPILTFVYGEAQLDGVAALVSTARLARNPDGQPAERQLLIERLLKECIHELGHTFGLVHCTDRRCVMARAASLFDVDAKRRGLCRECRLQMRQLRGVGGEGS